MKVQSFKEYLLNGLLKLNIWDYKIKLKFSSFNNSQIFVNSFFLILNCKKTLQILYWKLKLWIFDIYLLKNRYKCFIETINSKLNNYVYIY